MVFAIISLWYFENNSQSQMYENEELWTRVHLSTKLSILQYHA